LLGNCKSTRIVYPLLSRGHEFFTAQCVEVHNYVHVDNVRMQYAKYNIGQYHIQ